METIELKNIWKTLADEKIIGKDLAEENIERIISSKGSKTIAKLNKKLKFDYVVNVISAIFIVAATLFVSIFNKLHNHIMPIEAYLFLFLTLGFFVFKSLNLHSKIILLKSSNTIYTIKDSLKKAKKVVNQTSRREKYFLYISFISIVIFGNVLLNEYTDFKDFDVISLQGFVLIFSILSLILMPFSQKVIFRIRFSKIIEDINNSLNELEEKQFKN